ncbi:restriction endonuclease subunit S [Parabacteroides chinchillae]|uniref:Type I restriction enzyme, S subunit n=1 Tax=Parabacteroides chinchillae TaxID=871327 RepID=A0A8G2BVU0_9BACT|nr:restriction endonuclease subunit S [Parabacteroides chinchillae]SEF77451.1 type I restriction enzyme, S subunit [Parabacteroides chinchillae]
MVLPNSLSSYYEKFIATGEVKCIDEEIPFEIPQGWEWERIGNIFETTSGSTPLSRNPDYYKNGNINWVRTTDLNNGILNKTEIQITSKAVIDYNLSILPQTSVCVAMYGGAGTIGKHCILHFDTTINQSVCAIQPNGFCNMDYIHTFIEYQRPFWMDFAAGSRKDPNINQLIIKHCLLPIPPQEEQLRIVIKLNQLYPYIYQYGNSQNRLNQINKEIWHSLKKSILQEAIQGKLVPQIAEEGTAQELLEQIQQEKQKLVKEGKLKKAALNDSIIYKGDDNKYWEKNGKIEKDITNEIPFEIPDSWCWIRLNNLCNITNGFTPLRTELKFWKNGNINWFTVEDIRKQGEYIYETTKKITELAVNKDRIVRAGSVLLCCTASVGQCAMTMIPTTTNQQFNALTVKEEYRCIVNDEFLFLFAKTLEPILHDLAGKTTFEFISVKKVGNILIPIPPVLEQHRICKVANKAIASIMSR